MTQNITLYTLQDNIIYRTGKILHISGRIAVEAIPGRLANCKMGCFHGASFRELLLNWSRKASTCHIQLFLNEEILVTTNQDKIVLTSQRVHLNDKDWGRSYHVALFLESISFIENIYKSNPVEGIGEGQVQNFVDKVEAAMADRMSQLFQR